MFFSNTLFAARQIAARQKGWGTLGRRLGMGRWDLDDYRWFSCLNAVPFNMFKTAIQAGGPSKPFETIAPAQICPNPCPKEALAFAHQRCHHDLDDGQHVEYVSVWKWITMKWQLEYSYLYLFIFCVYIHIYIDIYICVCVCMFFSVKIW